MNGSGKVIALKTHHERAAIHLDHVEMTAIDEELTAGRTAGCDAASGIIQQLVNQGCQVIDREVVVTIHVNGSKIIGRLFAQQQIDHGCHIANGDGAVVVHITNDCRLNVLLTNDVGE